jgi:hypothetical protein
MMIVVYYMILSHVPYVHDLDSITPLFSDHMPDTGVSENNRVILLKSRTECTRDRNQITRNGHQIHWTIQEPRTSQLM